MSHDQNHKFIQSQLRECMKSCSEAYAESLSAGLSSTSEEMKALYSDLIDISQEFDLYTRLLSDRRTDVSAIDGALEQAKGAAAAQLQAEKARMMSDLIDDPLGGDDDEGVEFRGGDESAGLICPITSTLPETPVISRLCHHVYDRAAIIDYITQQQQHGIRNVVCPCIGCEQPISMRSIVEDAEVTKKVNRAKRKTDKHWEKM